MIALVALHLILLHTVDGHEVLINPKMVTTLHAGKKDQDNKFYTEAVQCVISLADGKFVGTAESCDAVRKMMEDNK